MLASVGRIATGTRWNGGPVWLGDGRYLYLVHQRGSGSPSELLLTDRPLVACIALWGLAVVAIIYRPFGL